MTSPSARRIATCLLVVLGLPWEAGASAPAGQSVPVDSTPLLRARGPVGFRNAPGELRAQRVELNPAAFGVDRSGRLPDTDEPGLVELQLFGEDALLIESVERRALAGGGVSWVGRTVDGPLGHAAFVLRNGRVFGAIRRPGLNLQIRPLAGGGHRMVERDDSEWQEEPDDAVPVWGVSGSIPASTPSRMPVGNPVVDVLVVYTPDARIGAGGTDAMESLIALGELETNTSYANSGVNQRIRVVHTAEIPYTETGNSSTDLSRLSNPSDGFLDGVHALRDTYGADIVSLWLENTGCGRGYLMSTVSSTFESLAFNVCRRTCATGNLTFGHELGHNMSLRHDWYVDEDTTPYVYNHGFVDIDVDVGSSFRTVMAYGNRCSDVFGQSCTRLQYFSNPAVFVGGDASGVASGTSANCMETTPPVTECDADNRRALNDSAATVAGFRPTQVLAELNKSVDLTFADVTDQITYTLTVVNNGSLTAEDVVIEDVVPLHTSLDAGSLSIDAATTGTLPGSTITWTTNTDLAAGQSLVRTFTVTATEGGVVANTATVTSTNLATTSVQTSNTVSTSIWAAVDCGFLDGFESGALSHHWRVDATADGRARVLTNLPDSGSYSAVLDDAVPSGATSEAALVLAANLAGMSSAQLDFRWADVGDETDPEDGVFIRESEVDSWVKVLDFPAGPDLAFQSASIDLVAAAAANSRSLTDGFQIKLQFYDNFPADFATPSNGDGYVFDNVSLSCGCSTELPGTTVTGPIPVVEQSTCSILAGPAYSIASGADLTLHSEQSVVLRDDFSVMDGGELTVEVGPLP